MSTYLILPTSQHVECNQLSFCICHTGLIRFGYRDYSPQLGRFTALDPARDMRGDGDLWDYCVDDPISCATS
ncbi:RHS repeat-associated core domain-containing protein [Desulfovibrio subterraneus]|uniref:RHS repeat-associated core domain-containing protein n=1 Tax=Desulfovibrio subterraneus TaxID=2718620 RepID=UPI0038CD77D9